MNTQKWHADTHLNESCTGKMNASEDQLREFRTVLYFFTLPLSWSGVKKSALLLSTAHGCVSIYHSSPLPAKC